MSDATYLNNSEINENSTKNYKNRVDTTYITPNHSFKKITNWEKQYKSKKVSIKIIEFITTTSHFFAKPCKEKIIGIDFAHDQRCQIVIDKFIRYFFYELFIYS
jgi:hypothetical protein